MSTPDEKPRRMKVEPGIYRTPSGALEIGFRDAGGRQRWRRVEGGRRAAKAALAEEHAKRARGERVAADPRLKVKDAADAWWDARVERLRPATQAAYRSALLHLLKPENFGRARMVDVTPTDVARFVSRQQRAGLKGSTIRGQLVALQGIYAYASRHMGLTSPNPVALLDRVERPSRDDERPKRILVDDELARLLAAVDEPYRLLFTLAAETGARLGEVLGLVWDDIDFEAATLRISHQLDRKGRRQPLKTAKSRRVLEVTPGLVVKLRAARMASPRSQGHDLVFVSAAGTGHDHRNIGGRVLARAVRSAGLEAVVDTGTPDERMNACMRMLRPGIVTAARVVRAARDGALVDGEGQPVPAFTTTSEDVQRWYRDHLIVPAPSFHDLRHSHASALIADGWDIEEIRERLGHSTIATTMKVYAHEFDAARRSTERRSRLEARYGGGSVEAPMEAPEGLQRDARMTGDAAGGPETRGIRVVSG